MYKLIIRFILASIFATASFETNAQANNVSIFTKFPIEKKIKELAFYNLNETSVQQILLFHDTLLLMGTEPSKSTHLFSSLSISSKKLLNPVIPFGRKKGQSFGLLPAGIFKDYLWGYDGAKNAVLLYNMDSALKNPQYISPLEYRLANRYYYASLLNENEVLASGDYSSDYKLAFVDLRTGAVTTQQLLYNIKTNGPMDWYEKHAAESFMYTNTEGSKAVLAKRFGDEIEIVDLKTGKSKIIRGPEGFLPDLKRMKTPGGLEVAVPNEKTRYAFISSSVTNKYIYLMFSGNTMETEHKFYGNSIYVFDWNGKPVKKLILNGDRFAFTVTSDDKTIYLLDPKTNTINVATIQ